MKILVVNCGSSSIKYKLFDAPANRVLAKGSIEKIGEQGSSIRDHSQGIGKLFMNLVESKAVRDLNQISAIGHRVVHGGESFREPHIIDDAVIKKIKECVILAPLHNPANLAGIIGCRKHLPSVLQVAVFDTSFHQTIPEQAFMYALPYHYYEKYKIRKYGFHGTSHQFIALEASRILKKPLQKLKLITCHLGNGCSITAVSRGKSIDTSMGFTPLEGLMMGTRSGDIDVAAVLHIMDKEGLSLHATDELLNKKSGFLGVSGVSNDLREIRAAMQKNNSRARLAYDMFCYRLKKYIGAYYFILGGVDAVCFTGGIGENAPDLIAAVKKDIARLNDGSVKVLVIATDEEQMIAKLTYQQITQRKPQRKGARI